MLTVYKASAGSGKTFTLALTYISTLLGLKVYDEKGDASYVLNSNKYAPGGRRFANRHSGILAITFTNKATAEMKQRIIEELNKLAVMPESGEGDTKYAEILTGRFGCTRKELAEVAEAALKELLCDYSRFNISTIDSFFQVVLRTFAREVNHQGDYSIQLNDSDAVNAGIGLMLDDINNGRHPDAARLKRWIDTLVIKNTMEGSKFNVFDTDSALQGNLRKFVVNMCGEEFRRRAPEMEAYLKTDKLRELGLAIAKMVDVVYPYEGKKIGRRLRRLLEEEGVEYNQLSWNVENLIEKLEKEQPLTSADAGENATKAFKNVLDFEGDASEESDIKGLFKQKNLPKAGKRPIFPRGEFVMGLKDCATAVRDLYMHQFLMRKALVACYNLEFLSFASEYIDVYRKDNNLILLSDTNELLRRIIKDEELPFIYERLGMTLTNLLIDEFQDTSVMQWENLKPLMGHALASRHDNLIIGDVKQAIYRFRSSDSSMLDHGVESEFPRDHVTRGNVPSENSNHRSAHGVVRFNNTLFTQLSKQLGVPGYEGVRQDLPEHTGELPAYVRVDFLNVKGGSEPELDLKRMATDIIRQHDEGGYKWSDIAVLVRGRADGVRVVNYLLEHHKEVPVISDEALLLDGSPAVQLILSMLRIVDEAYAYAAGDSMKVIEERRYATRREVNMMISRFNFYLGENMLPEEALHKAIYDAPEEAEKIHLDVDDVISRRPANPTALVETIVAMRLGADMRMEQHAYIAAFQDVMESFFATHEGGIKAFLSWWNDNRKVLALATPPDLDAVSVMTIHKSKGLEWPCVLIPCCDWPLHKSDPDIWYDVRPLIEAYLPDATGLVPPMLMMDSSADFGSPDSPLASQYDADIREQMADELNVTYVAFTRARDELIITCPMSVNSKGEERLPGVSCELKKAMEIDRTALDVPPEERRLTIDLSLERSEEADAPRYCFTLGEPTKNPARHKAVAEGHEAYDPGAYEVVLRSEGRELAVVDDALTEAYLSIGEEENKHITDLDELEDGKYQDERMAEAAERGTNIHNMLSLMRSREDLPKAIATVGRVGKIPNDERRAIREMLERAFDEGGERVKGWFGKDIDVLSEREIYVPGSPTPLRPDRVVRYPDGSIDVVDYKFTTKPLRSHREQVGTYRSLLKEMHPGSEVRAYLWYPELLRLIEF